MNKPLVSILIPNYNYGHYLSGCIESVINQTYPNIEIIFRDNNSSDNSYDIALKYQKLCKERGINFFVAQNKRNIGSSGNTEKCFHESEGEYMFWLSSDDEIKPTFVERAMNVLLNNPNVGLVMMHRDEMDENGNIINVEPFYNSDCIIPGETQAAVFMMAGIAVPSQLLFRRSTYSTMCNSKSLRFQVAGDWYDNFMMSCHSDVAYIKEPLCNYRIHTVNETSDSEKKLVGIFEHYQLINAFLWISKSYGMKKPANRYDEAVRKLGDMCMRYTLKMLKHGEKKVASKYLQLAPIFKEEIVEEEVYKHLYSFIALEGEKLDGAIKEFEQKCVLTRTVSYDPPEGYIPIDITGKLSNKKLKPHLP